MKDKTSIPFIVLFALSTVGLTQFADGVRTVDVIGLFASGALAGAAIAGFFITKRNS
jgi:hypothetical protein